MGGKHYLPKNGSKFEAWVTNFLNILQIILARVGFPEAVYATLAERLAVFSEKLRVAGAPDTRTKTAVLDKNDARKALESYLRQAIGEYMRHNHLVTDTDRDNLGLPVYKTRHDPAPVATTFPWIQVKLNIIRHLRFDFGHAKTSKAKPAGQRGMELAGRIGGGKPANVHEMTLSYINTHTPLIIAFEEEDRGKTFWFAVRWENTTGKKGPWSDIQSALIP